MGDVLQLSLPLRPPAERNNGRETPCQILLFPGGCRERPAPPRQDNGELLAHAFLAYGELTRKAEELQARHGAHVGTTAATALRMMQRMWAALNSATHGRLEGDRHYRALHARFSAVSDQIREGSVRPCLPRSAMEMADALGQVLESGDPLHPAVATALRSVAKGYC